MTTEAGQEASQAGDAPVDDVSATFIGQWRHLVSTTNWTKGRIIHEWRLALIEAGAPVAEYSDETWSQRVGQVSPQHVGRLRRTFERFGEVHEQYESLFWSHFQAALDWDDAEMWLEGAVQSRWSVSQMRRQRWKTHGGDPAAAPQDADVVESEFDEDAFAAHDAEKLTVGDESADVRDPSREFRGSDETFEPDFGDESELPEGELPPDESTTADALGADAQDDRSAPRRTMAELPQLPRDLTDAFESFKLAVLRHRSLKWQEVQPDDVVATLDALRELVLAGADEQA